MTSAKLQHIFSYMETEFKLGEFKQIKSANGKFALYFQLKPFHKLAFETQICVFKDLKIGKDQYENLFKGLKKKKKKKILFNNKFHNFFLFFFFFI
jgi:hypothetical protein